VPNYPAKPVTLLVGFSAGSTTDAGARVWAQQVSDSTGQQVVVVNRDGAAGYIAAGMVAKSKPDGYTLMWGTASQLAASPGYDKKIPYDAIGDFAPVSIYVYLPYVMAMHPALPAKNLTELVTLARAHPGKITFGSTGVGGILHLAVELMQTKAGISMVHVPYRGTPTLMLDLLSGQVDLCATSISLVLGHVQKNKLRAIAVTTTRRSGLIPDVPTMSEAGLGGYDIAGWYAPLAPAATPRNIIDLLYKETVKAIEQPRTKSFMAQEGAYAGGNTPEQFAAYMKEEIAKYTKLVKDAGLKSE
jgi:tripartite-type tricarboxylate transporter receptor subunit TctC